MGMKPKPTHYKLSLISSLNFISSERSVFRDSSPTRGLTAETVSSSAAERSVATRAALCPFFTSTEFMRNYATGRPAKEQKVKVPVTMFGVSGNYASALYISAVKANVLEKVESELLTLVEASKKSPTFSQFMKDLSVTADTRVKAINDICSQAKFSDITKNFL
ncbi:UNVERIFIED_CONTAM: ATP synthase subunit O, mitochondrial, partial [Sesamum latifolium]